MIIFFFCGSNRNSETCCDVTTHKKRTKNHIKYKIRTIEFISINCQLFYNNTDRQRIVIVINNGCIRMTNLWKVQVNGFKIIQKYLFAKAERTNPYKLKCNARLCTCNFFFRKFITHICGRMKMHNAKCIDRMERRKKKCIYSNRRKKIIWFLLLLLLICGICSCIHNISIKSTSMCCCGQCVLRFYMYVCAMYMPHVPAAVDNDVLRMHILWYLFYFSFIFILIIHSLLHRLVWWLCVCGNAANEFVVICL